MAADLLQQMFYIEFSEAFTRLQQSYDAYTSQAQYEGTKLSVYCPEFGIPVSPEERDDSLQRQQNLYQDYANAYKYLNGIRDERARQKVELRTAISRAEFDPAAAQELARLQEEWDEMRTYRELEFGIFLGEICEVRSVTAAPVPEIEIQEKALGYKQDIARFAHALTAQPFMRRCALKNYRARSPEFIQYKSQHSTYLAEPLEITGEK